MTSFLQPDTYSRTASYFCSNKNIIYLDMDGVVADFNKRAYSILGINKVDNVHLPDEEWNKLKERQRIFRDLPKTSEADFLVNFCKELYSSFGIEIRFLTAIPHDNDFPWVFEDKKAWCEKHFPEIPLFFGPYAHDKWKHAKPGDILIDDRTSNIDEWIKAGGIGILHEGDVLKTLNELTFHLSAMAKD